MQIYRLGFFVSLLAALLVGFLIDEDYDYVGIIVGFVCAFISFGIAYWMIDDSNNGLTISEKCWYLAGWEGTEELRDFINTNGIGDEWNDIKHTYNGECRALWHHSGISLFWGFLIKYFIPVILSVILTSTIQTDDEERYEGYQRKHLAIGIVIFSCMVVIVFVIALFPQILKQTSDATATIQGGKSVRASNEMKSMSGATKSKQAKSDNDKNAGSNDKDIATGSEAERLKQEGIVSV